MSRSAIRPVKKMPVETQATDALREAIVSGSIEEGSRITETAIADEMGLGRQTVRMAFHQLAKEGLLIQVPYTGWSVLALSANDVWELYTLRSSLERLAARLLAEAIDDSRAKVLSDALHNLIAACDKGKPGPIAESDFALHKTIIELTGHSRLARQYELLEQQIRMYIRSSDALEPDPREIVNQHVPIVEAILAADASTSGRLSEEHNLSEGGKLAGHIDINAGRGIGNVE